LDSPKDRQLPSRCTCNSTTWLSARPIGPVSALIFITKPSAVRESLSEYIDQRSGPKRRAGLTVKASPDNCQAVKRWREPPAAFAALAAFLAAPGPPAAA